MLATGQEQTVSRLDRVAFVAVIAVDVLKGDGTQSAPYTAYTQFWTTDNKFIGEVPTDDIQNYTIRHCIR